MYIYLCLYLYLYVYLYLYLSIYLFVYIYIYIYVYIYIYSGLKSHSGQLSISTSKNSSVVNIICINSFRYKHEYLSAILLRVNVLADKGSGRNEM